MTVNAPLDPAAIRRAALANGFEPIPTHGKAPRWASWSEGEITETRLAEIEAAHPEHQNTGIRTGKCVGVDIDLTNEAHARDIEKLVSNALGASLLRRVGSKGALLVYRNESPIQKITIGTKTARLVEVLGSGQQFVGFGSHPETGKPYEWTNEFIGAEPTQTPLADLIQVTPEGLRAVAVQMADRLKQLGYGDVTVSEAGARIEVEPTAAAGSPVSAAHVEAMLRAIPPDVRREEWLTICGGLVSAPVADSDWNGEEVFVCWSRGDFHGGIRPSNFAGVDDCTAQWDRDQQKRADGGSVPAFGALVNLARANGYTGPSDARDPTFAFAGFGVAASLGARSFDAVMARTVPQIQEILPDYFEKGIPTFLAGRGESFKSLFSLQVAMYVAAGHKILGRQPMKIARAVVVTSEDGCDEVDRRAQRIASRSGITGDIPLTLIDRVGKDSSLVQMHEGGTYELKPFWKELTDYLKSIDGHKLLVLDSCLDFVSFAGKAKIDEGAVNVFIKNILQRVCDECDATLIVLWHPSQSGQDRGDASGWSVSWHNSPRARLSMTSVKDVDGAVELKVEKRSHGKKPKPVVLHWNAGTLLPLTEGAVGDQQAALIRSCVRVATLAAQAGAPLQQQRHLIKWQIDEIEKDVGRRPPQREIKEALSAALPLGLLMYVRGSQTRAAGFFPGDTERAAELARDAKRGRDHGGAHV